MTQKSIRNPRVAVLVRDPEFRRLVKECFARTEEPHQANAAATQHDKFTRMENQEP